MFAELLLIRDDPPGWSLTITLEERLGLPWEAEPRGGFDRTFRNSKVLEGTGGVSFSDAEEDDSERGGGLISSPMSSCGIAVAGASNSDPREE